jgi:hypothetical protein
VRPKCEPLADDSPTANHFFRKFSIRLGNQRQGFGKIVSGFLKRGTLGIAFRISSTKAM